MRSCLLLISKGKTSVKVVEDPCFQPFKTFSFQKSTLSREVMYVPSLETFEARLDEDLISLEGGNLVHGRGDEIE